MLFTGEEITVDLENDKIIKELDEPTFMTDRRREELRVNKDGYYYLHTDNDRENELIYTEGFIIREWVKKNGVEL